MIVPLLLDCSIAKPDPHTRACSLPEVYLAAMSGAPNRAPPGTGVESLEEMRKRVASVLWDIARRHAGHRVVVVSHGGTLGQLRALSANSPKPGAVANCSVGTVLADAETRTACIMSWGNTEHLGEDSVGLTEGGGGRGG